MPLAGTVRVEISTLSSLSGWIFLAIPPAYPVKLFRLRGETGKIGVQSVLHLSEHRQTVLSYAGQGVTGSIKESRSCAVLLFVKN